ncbi:MAG TPA: iron-containing alcohol dehydrogenase [Candidatus Acidoferrum sp.]|nr:iron-containing alcohol dehydrogenase [Candidatus Acidoferrum sp.]
MWFFTSPKIAFGEDSLEQLSSIEGKRVLIITDLIVSKLGLLEVVTSELKKQPRAVEVFDQVEAEPSFENVEKVAAALLRFQPDLIVALGGGSCIDAAKGAWVLYERPDLKLDAVSPLTKLDLRRKARLVAIPTTAGTGSDATWVAVLTDKSQNMKLDYFASRELVPDYSILNPKFLLKLPRQATAHTGLDAIDQGIEAYVSQWRNDFADSLALRSIQILFEYLPKAYDNPDDMVARQKTQNAATMSGLAFGNSQVGLAHATGHALGAIFHMAHGLAVGISNPYVIEFSSRDAAQLYRDIAYVIGIKEESAKAATGMLVESIKSLMVHLRVPLSLREAGISQDAFKQNLETLIEQTNRSTCTFVNPRVPDPEEVRKLFACMYEGRPVDF